MPAPQQPKKAIPFRLLGVGAFAAFAAVGAIANAGTTTLESIATGDCFIMSDDLEVDRFDTEPCSETHDSQVVGEVAVPRTGAFPAATDDYWNSVFDECLDRAFEVVDVNAVPEDATIEMFTPLANGWAVGERNTICVLYSESGLEGSLLAADR